MLQYDFFNPWNPTTPYSSALLSVLTVNSNRLKPSRPDWIHNFKQACHHNAHSPLFTFYHSDTTVQDNARYWEQMYQSHTQEMSAEERDRRRRRNFHLVGYCFLTMALGIGAHFVFFRWNSRLSLILFHGLSALRSQVANPTFPITFLKISHKNGNNHKQGW